MGIIKVRLRTFSGFFKVFSLTSVGSGFKLLSSFLIGKLLAVYYGPSGMVLIGQVNNLLTIGGNLTTLGTRFGMVKLSANASNESKRNIAFQSSLIFITLVYFIVAVIAFAFHNRLTIYTFNNDHYSLVITVLIICLPIANFFTLSNSFLNGELKYKAQIVMNIVAAAFTFFVLLFYILTKSTIENLLIGVIFANCFIGFLTIYWLRDRYRILIPSKSELILSFKVLWTYGKSGLIISIWAPFSLLVVRSYILDNFSPTVAGNWEIVMRSSALYLMFFFNAISTYFLPKFSSDRPYALSKVFNIILMCAVGAGIVFLIGYLLRYELISFAFSDKFKGAGELFVYQFLTDLIRITIYPIVMYMLGTGKLLIYGILEIAAPTFMVLFFTLKFGHFDTVNQVFALNLYAWLGVLVFAIFVFLINRNK